MRWTTRAAISAVVIAACAIGARASTVSAAGAATPAPTSAANVGAGATAAMPAPVPEPSPPFGRVIYRAARVAGFESLGVTMIACRHRDPVARRFAIDFFDRSGRRVQTFGNADASTPTPAGKKVVFVTDGMPFKGRDVLNVHLGHLAIGTARIVSDAVVVHCVGKMRMDGGIGRASYRDEIGLVRAGAPLPALPTIWGGPPPYALPHR